MEEKYSAMEALLISVNNKSEYNGPRFYFTGDLNQLGIALTATITLGIDVTINGGIPFVKSKEEFDKVKKYLIEQKLDGWHHYVSYEEYCELQGEYYLNGSKGEKKEEIFKAAKELGIMIYETTMKVPFVKSKEEYDSIIDLINNNCKLTLNRQ